MIAPDDGTLQAWAALQARLRGLEASGYVVPCIDMPDLFLSDERAERESAASWCVECPAADTCAGYADAAAEPFGVWGGQDRSPRVYQRRDEVA